MFTRDAPLECSYAAHHAKRVEVIAATDDQLQFELDTTAAEGRQVMLQNPAGASAMKVCGMGCEAVLRRGQSLQRQRNTLTYRIRDMF